MTRTDEDDLTGDDVWRLMVAGATPRALEVTAVTGNEGPVVQALCRRWGSRPAGGGPTAGTRANPMQQREARSREELIELAKARGYARPEVWAGFVLRAREARLQRGGSVRRWAKAAPPAPRSND